MGIGASIPSESFSRLCARCAAGGLFLLVVSGLLAWAMSPTRHAHLSTHLTGIDAGAAPRP